MSAISPNLAGSKRMRRRSFMTLRTQDRPMKRPDRTTRPAGSSCRCWKRRSKRPATGSLTRALCARRSRAISRSSRNRSEPRPATRSTSGAEKSRSAPILKERAGKRKRSLSERAGSTRRWKISAGSRQSPARARLPARIRSSATPDRWTLAKTRSFGS